MLYMKKIREERLC